MCDYLQSLDQIMEKIIVGLDETMELSTSLPNIPFVELNSEYNATMITLISTVSKIENDIRDAEEAIQNVPEEGVVGVLVVAGTPHIEARVEVRHDILLLRSCMKGAEGMVEGVKELVKGWMERRAITNGGDAAVVDGDDAK